MLMSVLAGGLFFLPASAQVSPDRVGTMQDAKGNATPDADTLGEPSTRRSVTPTLLRQPVYQGIAEKMDRLRSTLRSKKTPGEAIGSRHTFYVRDVTNLSEWKEIEAELLARTSGVQFWMEEGEVQLLRKRGRLRTVLDSLKYYTARGTPAPSVESAQGILPIVHEYFGSPPNVDGDDRVDLLLLDIQDQYEQTGSYVAGFFDPNDLTTNAHSNRRDLLYLDTRPTLLRDDSLHLRQAASTLAHEYQHLVHAHYEGERRERTFVNEGLSEYAEILCGFPPRSAAPHLSAPTRPLLSWNYDRPIPDYSRASLFTHYVFEQIGAKWADDWVQHRANGLEGLREVLKRAGGPSFRALFRNWGRALLLNDRSDNPAYGYRHPARKEVRFEREEAVEGMPETVDLSMGALSHIPIRIPLVERVALQSHSSADLAFDAQLVSPDAPDRFWTDVRERQGIEANRARHGTVRLLATNLSTAPDSERVDVQVLTQGRHSAQQQTLSYGDGVPDAYSGNASYLLLDEPGEAIGVAFDPEKRAWLNEAAVDVVFMSELAGSEVPAEAPRRLVLQVRSLNDGDPGRALTPPLTRTVDRSFGHLKMASLSLDSEYETLSSLRDSVVVFLRSAHRSNPLAVGLDRVSGEEADVPAFHRKTEEASWKPLQKVRAEGRRLNGFQPLIQARIAVPEQRISSETFSFDTAFDERRAFIRVRAPFALDSARTHLYARLPSGEIREGRRNRNSAPEALLLARSSREAVFHLPSETGADYQIYVRAHTDDRAVARGHVTWKIPDDEATRLGTAYPNPTSGDATLPVRVLDPSRVKITLYDAIGRIVRRKTPRRVDSGGHELSVGLRDLSSGVYFARVETHRLRDGHVTTATRRIVRVR